MTGLPSDELHESGFGFVHQPNDLDPAIEGAPVPTTIPLLAHLVDALAALGWHPAPGDYHDRGMACDDDECEECYPVEVFGGKYPPT